MEVKFLLEMFLNKTFKWTLTMATLSAFLMILALGVNNYRHLFGFDRRYASDNFGFNFTFFIPVTFLALILGLLFIGITITNWKNWRIKWLLLALSFPTIGF